jgi:hypothetical protein
MRNVRWTDVEGLPSTARQVGMVVGSDYGVCTSRCWERVLVTGQGRWPGALAVVKPKACRRRVE